MTPTIGRIVIYKLSEQNCSEINRRRTSGPSISERIKVLAWPVGAQAHIGNSAFSGQELPMVVCRVWPDEFGAGVDGINGQVFLDGNDTLWITSAREGTEVGQWHWPERV